MKDREHNVQKFEDTKGVIRRHKSMKDREHNGQKFEDTKGVIRRHKSMEDREQNGQKFEDTKGFVSSDYSFGIFKLFAIVFSVLH
jgi:hypothetical protein